VHVYQHVVPNKTLFPEAVKGVLVCLSGLYLHRNFLPGTASVINVSRGDKSCSAGAQIAVMQGTD